MNALIRGWRYAAVAALILGLPLAAACSASDGTGSSENDETDDAELSIEWPTMYTAFGGSHEFKIPARLDGVKNAKWSADPSDAVSFEKQDDGSVMITTKKLVSDVKITAKAGSLKATATLHMDEATDELWQQGNDRYRNGVVFSRPDGGGGGHKGDGGGGWQKTINPNLACTNCHDKGGKGTDVEHTPTQTGGYSDEDLKNIFENATKPSWAKMRTMKLEQWQKIHKWQMDENEVQGLIIYLRALTPESQGTLDFGGGIFGGGKHKHDDSNSSSSSKSTDDKPATN
jgi:hypothetical protein